MLTKSTLKIILTQNIYKEALDECVAEYHDEDPDFYDGRVKFFEENDQ